VYLSIVQLQMIYLLNLQNCVLLTSVASVVVVVVCLSVTLCIVAKRCVLKQKLCLSAYRMSHMRMRNE